MANNNLLCFSKRAESKNFECSQHKQVTNDLDDGYDNHPDFLITYSTRFEISRRTP